MSVLKLHLTLHNLTIFQNLKSKIVTDTISRILVCLFTKLPHLIYGCFPLFLNSTIFGFESQGLNDESFEFDTEFLDFLL